MIKDILYEKTLQRLLEKELNPDKSVRLASWCSAEYSGSLRNDTETLFVNEQGSYYIIYEGGLLSGFHDLPGVESWFGGTYIRTLSMEEAYAWCEETGNADAIDAHLPFYMISISRKPSREGV